MPDMPDNQTQSTPNGSRTSPARGPHFRSAVLKARKGRFADAGMELLRARNQGECSDAEALDLQARMYAQQGLYLQAESCWRRAMQVGGPKPEYASALGRLYVSRAPRAHLVLVACGVIAAVVLLVVIWQMVLVLPARHRQVVRDLQLVRENQAAVESAMSARFTQALEAVSAAESRGQQREEAATARLLAALGDLAGGAETLRTSQEAALKQTLEGIASVTTEVAVSRRQATEVETRVRAVLEEMQRASSVRETSAELARANLREEIQRHISGLSARIDAQGSELGVALDEQSRGMWSALAAMQAQLDCMSMESAAAFDSLQRQLGELRLMLRPPAAPQTITEARKGTSPDH